MMLHCYVNSMSPPCYSPSKCYHVVLSACYPQHYFNYFSHCQQEEQIRVNVLPFCHLHIGRQCCFLYSGGKHTAPNGDLP